MEKFTAERFSNSRRVRNLVVTHISRPDPKSYFSDPAKGFMSWDDVIARFAAEKSYWVCTANGGPHAMPVWGIWHDSAFKFSTSPESRKAKNLRTNANAIVHLGDTETVVSLHCHAKELTNVKDQQTFCDIYNPKYDWTFSPSDVSGGLFSLTPHTAFAWAGGDEGIFNDSGTRFRLAIQQAD